MKNNIFTKQNFRIAFVIFYIFVVIAGVSYGYLMYSYNDELETDMKEYRIPYKALPDNCNIMITLPSGSGYFSELQFTENKITVTDILNTDEYPLSFDGKEINYRISMSYELISSIIDLTGGVELTVSNETLRYTGIQVINLISSVKLSNELKTSITKAVITNISKEGLSQSDFSYLIENADTDLTVPICYEWDKYIKDMCKNAVFAE